ncbi:lamin tail domain-containing protein [Natrinema gelatinilyticum]|uniref:lamin tail domain-containing protein n=1 Tax=Natrinema gelatinilyticum TaxID=2961571 RepID=UPI0020C55AF4|nr:lamin tail domain-containing protein [Natrinema gelatinilyticum]
MVDVTVTKLKQVFLYGVGFSILLVGLGGTIDGGLGLLGGPILIATALLIMPKTRGLIVLPLTLAGGPDLSTLGRGVFIIVILVGIVVGGVLLPPAEPTAQTPSASNSTNSPASPEETQTDDQSSEDISDSQSDTSQSDTSDSSSEPTDDGTSGSSSDSNSDSPSDSTTDDTSDSTSDSPTDDTSDSSGDDSSDSSDPSDNGPQSSWTVTVVSVTDGDTLDVRMPDGSTETIRLLGVDTPETSAGSTDPPEWEGISDNTDGREWLENWGGKASSYAEQRLAGKEIYIEVDPESDRRGSYGRLLAYAYQSKSAQKSFNLRLLENGYARMYDSQFTKRSEYRSAESIAQINDVGVWDYTDSSPSPSPSGGSSLAVSTIHADAPGNDHENLNGEYIGLTNEGSNSVNLGGWSVADAADHTYYFPSGFTLGAGDSVRIYTGSGSNSNSALYWGSGTAVWNNSGDTIIVTNDSGSIVINREYAG